MNPQGGGFTSGFSFGATPTLGAPTASAGMLLFVDDREEVTLHCFD